MSFNPFASFTAGQAEAGLDMLAGADVFINMLQSSQERRLNEKISEANIALVEANKAQAMLDIQQQKTDALIEHNATRDLNAPSYTGNLDEQVRKRKEQVEAQAEDSQIRIQLQQHIENAQRANQSTQTSINAGADVLSRRLSLDASAKIQTSTEDQFDNANLDQPISIKPIQ